MDTNERWRPVVLTYDTPSRRDSPPSNPASSRITARRGSAPLQDADVGNFTRPLRDLPLLETRISSLQETTGAVSSARRDPAVRIAPAARAGPPKDAVTAIHQAAPRATVERHMSRVVALGNSYIRRCDRRRGARSVPTDR